MPEDDVQWLLKNDEASVKITVDTEGKGTRLKVEDVGSGSVIYLDPIELQALAWATREDLSVFTRPYFKDRANKRSQASDTADETMKEPEPGAGDQQEGE